MSVTLNVGFMMLPPAHGVYQYKRLKHPVFEYIMNKKTLYDNQPDKNTVLSRPQQQKPVINTLYLYFKETKNLIN